ACASAHGDNIVLAVTLGVLTGVGGGVLRDVLVNEKPYILTKHVYAVASILGSILYYSVSVYMDKQVLAALLASFVTVAIRLLAAKYHWNLPKIRFTDSKK
ncbi:MAG: TRIC cation channel family protein, partial [Clostridia bacterium]|nr:TRIC cation channel family protein [Clostridia bacterium]